MEKVLILSKKLWKAMQDEDIDFLRNHIHPEAMFVHMGVTLGRDEELDVIKERKIVYKMIEFQKTKVQTIGTTVIVLTMLRLTAVVGGQEVVNPFVVTEVYTNDDGLKLASLSYTRINY